MNIYLPLRTINIPILSENILYYTSSESEFPRKQAMDAVGTTNYSMVFRERRRRKCKRFNEELPLASSSVYKDICDQIERKKGKNRNDYF